MNVNLTSPHYVYAHLNAKPWAWVHIKIYVVIRKMCTVILEILRTLGPQQKCVTKLTNVNKQKVVFFLISNAFMCCETVKFSNLGKYNWWYLGT